MILLRRLAFEVPAAAGQGSAAPARPVGRAARRLLVRSVYVLSAPLTAAAGLLLSVGGLAAWLVARRIAPGSRFARHARRVVGRSGDLEWNRARWLRAATGAPMAGSRRPRPTPGRGSGPWLELAYAVLAVPLAAVAGIVTATWWSVGVGTATFPLRGVGSGPLRPLELDLGTSKARLAVSLGVTTPATRLAFAVGLAVIVLATLPLVVRGFAAAHLALARELLSTDSVRGRRARTLEAERACARASAVAVVNAEAAALRRLERDIHDGAQQQLVRLVMDLGRAQRHADTSPQFVRAALAEGVERARDALEELRALSRGIAPPVLTDRGLPAALAALAARSAVPAELDAQPLGEVVTAGSETAAYFVVAEALTNVAKHSGADRCTVGLRQVHGSLEVWVTDDGAGGASLAAGHGLCGLADRVAAVGGLLSVDSPAGGPTTIRAYLPCE